MQLRPLLIACLLAASAVACTNETAGPGASAEPASEQASRLVVEYKYGNRITESTVRIYENGVVVRTESSCCPGRIDPVLTAPLEASRVTALLADIERVDDSADDEDEIDALSPKAARAEGELTVVKSSGRRVTLRAFGDKTRVNTSPRSRAIVDLVNGLARQKMPL